MVSIVLISAKITGITDESCWIMHSALHTMEGHLKSNCDSKLINCSYQPILYLIEFDRGVFDTQQSFSTFKHTNDFALGSIDRQMLDLMTESSLFLFQIAYQGFHSMRIPSSPTWTDLLHNVSLVLPSIFTSHKIKQPKQRFIFSEWTKILFFMCGQFWSTSPTLESPDIDHLTKRCPLHCFREIFLFI